MASNPTPPPRWVAAAAGIAGAVTGAGIVAVGAVPGGSLGVALVIAAGLLALALTVPPLAVTGMRRRRVSIAALVALALVGAGAVTTMSGTSQRLTVAAVGPELEHAHDTGTCPSSVGVFVVLECLAVGGGTVVLLDGAGATSFTGYAVFDEPPAGAASGRPDDGRTHVSDDDGFAVTVWHLEGRLYEVAVDHGEPLATPVGSAGA